MGRLESDKLLKMLKSYKNLEKLMIHHEFQIVEKIGHLGDFERENGEVNLRVYND